MAASTRIRRPLDGREPGPPEGVDPEVYAGCLDLYEQMLELGGLGRAA